MTELDFHKIRPIEANRILYKLEDQIRLRTEKGECWFRVEATQYAPPLDEYGDVVRGGEGTIELRVDTFKVLKNTPTGVQLEVYSDQYGWRKRFVSRKTNKRFACPTLPEALESFIARKKKQISIYNARIRSWTKMQELAEAAYAATLTE